jgi:hypothetical protein
MTTYSVRCRVNACRHRRVTRTHPDAYKVVPRCPACGARNGWRIEGREYNRKNLCRCSGPEMQFGRYYPHRTTHPLCDNNPDGPRNQELARGTRPEDLPLELMGTTYKGDGCPF